MFFALLSFTIDSNKYVEYVQDDNLSNLEDPSAVSTAVSELAGNLVAITLNQQQV